MNIQTQKNTKGFVILIAVLVSGLMLSIGAFIANIAVKELALSSSGRDSQIAFYAADAALECALYQDLRILAFASSSTDPGPTSVYCNGVSIATTTTSTGSATDQDTFFDISFVTSGVATSTSPYARVKVHKENIGTVNDKTVIEARGYNVQNISTPSRVERALQVIY